MHQSKTIFFLNYLQIQLRKHAQYMLKKEFSPFSYLKLFPPNMIGSIDTNNTKIKIASIILLQDNIFWIFYDKTLWYISNNLIPISFGLCRIIAFSLAFFPSN